MNFLDFGRYDVRQAEFCDGFSEYLHLESGDEGVINTGGMSCHSFAWKV